MISQRLEYRTAPGTVDCGIVIEPLGRVLGLGVEIGALETFFSSQDERLGSAQRHRFSWAASEDGSAWGLDADLSLGGGRVRVEEQGRLTPGTGERSLSVTACTDTLLMDAVLRFVVPASRVTRVQLGDETIPHRSQNRYHQRPVRPVTLALKDGPVLRFIPRVHALPDGMSPLVYARDERGAWVFHVRLLATRPSAVLLKGCHRLFNRPFPFWLDQTLRRVPGLVERSLYLRERVSQRIPFQANGAVALPRGSVLRLSVEWSED